MIRDRDRSFGFRQEDEKEFKGSTSFRTAGCQPVECSCKSDEGLTHHPGLDLCLITADSRSCSDVGTFEDTLVSEMCSNVPFRSLTLPLYP